MDLARRFKQEERAAAEQDESRRRSLAERCEQGLVSRTIHESEEQRNPHDHRAGQTELARALLLAAACRPGSR